MFWWWNVYYNQFATVAITNKDFIVSFECQKISIGPQNMSFYFIWNSINIARLGAFGVHKFWRFETSRILFTIQLFQKTRCQKKKHKYPISQGRKVV